MILIATVLAAVAAVPVRAGALTQTSTTLPAFSGACAEDPSTVCVKVREWTHSDGWASAAEWFVARPLTIMLIIVAAWITNRIAHVLIKRGVNRVADPQNQRARGVLRRATPAVLQRTQEVGLRSDARTQTLTTVFRSVASIVIWFVAVVWILGVLDVNVAPLIASSAVIGVALGLGAQSIVRDFLAGTFMVIEDQFGVGDVVDLGEAKGTVEEITLRATRVRDVHGTLWHIPNGQIARVANKSQTWARAVLDLPVDGGTDYDRAALVIQHVADHLSADPRFAADIIDTPEVWGIESFVDGGYTIRLVIKTRPASQFRVTRELRIRMTEAFRGEGIRAPGSGRAELWVHDGDRQADTDPPSVAPPFPPGAPPFPPSAGPDPTATGPVAGLPADASSVTDPGLVAGSPPPNTTRSPAKGDPSEG